MSDSEWSARYGPWAVVTGASGGIGREIARNVGARGLNVLLAARRAPELEQLAGELAHNYKVDTRIVAGDLGTVLGTNALIEAAQDLDVGLFVANAGVGTSGPFVDGDLDAELAMIDLNVRALAAQTHHFARRLQQRGTGGLIFLSSIVSWQGVPRAANYAATKAYVQSLAEGLRRELKPAGVDVLASAPAQVATDFMERAGMQGDGVSAELVASSTLKALGRQTTVYPHFNSWFLSSALSMLPRALRVRILEAVMAGMTRS